MATNATVRAQKAWGPDRVSRMLVLVLGVLLPLAMTNYTSVGRYAPLTFDVFSLPRVVVALGVGGLAFALLGLAWILGRASLPNRWILAAAWAVPVLAMASALITRSPAEVWFGAWTRNEGVGAYLAYAMCFTLLLQFSCDDEWLERFVTLSLTAGVVVAAYGLLQSLGVDPLRWLDADFGNRASSTFGNPDIYAGYLLVPLGLAAGRLVAGPAHGRAWWGSLAMFATTLTAVFVSLVRGAWLAAVVVVLSTLAVSWTISNQRTRATGSIALAAALAIALSLGLTAARPQEGLGVGERVATTLSDPTGGSVDQRLRTYAIAAGIVGQAPLAGTGPDRFMPAFIAQADKAWWQRYGAAMVQDNAHSLPVQVVATLGVPALIAYVVMIVLGGVGFLRARGRWLEARGAPLSVGLGALGVGTGLLTGVSSPGVVVWLWILVGAAAGVEARNAARTTSAVRWAAGVPAAIMGLSALALATTWLYADARVDAAFSSPDVITADSAMEQAIGANPLTVQYPLLRAELWAAERDRLAQFGQPYAQAAQRAAQGYEAGYLRDPSSPEASIGMLLNGQSPQVTTATADPAQLLKVAEEVAARWPGAPQALVAAAGTQVRWGDPAVGARLAAQAASITPSFTEAWRIQARAAEVMGDVAAAQKYWALLLDALPNDEEAALAIERLR